MSDDDSLRQKVYELTWQGNLWGGGGAIAWSRSRHLYLKMLGKEGDGAMALASTYYTAGGNAFARAKQAALFGKPFWFLRGLWFTLLALHWSSYGQKLIGFKKMTHGQLDIRASILVKWKRYKKAGKYLRKALTRPDITDDSRALVLVKLGEVCNALGEKYSAAVVYWEASQIKGLEATTEVRVLKSLAQHWSRVKNKRRAQEHFERALILAEKNSLGDQVLKIKALLRRTKDV